MDRNKEAEIRSAQEALDQGRPDAIKPFGPFWPNWYWIKWATIHDICVHRLKIQPGASILDVGCGPGWTSVFLAEAGYSVVGIDIASPWLEIGAARASRWNVNAGFQRVDMDNFALGREFDAALVFDALHHSNNPSTVVSNVASHIRRGGWIVFGEPSWLHGFSPGARQTRRELGWVERGVPVSSLKSWCRRARLGHFRRFYGARNHMNCGAAGSHGNWFGWQPRTYGLHPTRPFGWPRGSFSLTSAS